MKLAKLPDRNPVRLTIAVMPDLNADLLAYAEAYRATYGEAASLADLIPEMLRGYLDSDRDFAKARKTLGQPSSGDNAEASKSKPRSPEGAS
ncbi:DUF2274 domain-containing protein [Caulobacter sp. UNC358MFTsu5.1]|uniref:DUF2274 domain-containing protein n=1 Tax=Caulobacter sp. UNC358MFTsu5.1 TaxID=1449049 RepID=UPI0004A6D03D|nr:DUF2274 domain-containing protein [Caulobacter sp. UNC358MFTsu5.1]